MKKRNILIFCLVFMLSFVLSGCGEDINQYKERVQQDNDRNNPTGNRAMCLAVGHISRSMYPYTIKHIDGDLENAHYRDPVYVNHKLNIRLSLYAKAGLFSEELVGDDNDKPLYRYQFTDEGQKYAYWWGGGVTYFCFGKVVVDKITAIDKLSSGKLLTYKFHYENIPDWLKRPEIYDLYWQIGGEDAINGKQILGSSTYSLTYDGQLGKASTSMSGRYVL